MPPVLCRDKSTKWDRTGRVLVSDVVTGNEWNNVLDGAPRRGKYLVGVV